MLSERAARAATTSYPKDVTRHLWAFLLFFADEPPELQRDRVIDEPQRDLENSDRDLLRTIASMLHEKTLPTELRDGSSVK